MLFLTVNQLIQAPDKMLYLNMKRKTDLPGTHFHTQDLLQHIKAHGFLGVKVDFASSLDRIPL